MSQPVSYCAILRAATCPVELKRLAPIMRANIKGGHFTIMACPHKPQCRKMTVHEQDRLRKEFSRDA